MDPSRTDVATLHVLQDNGPMLVVAVAYLMRISEDAALARLYRLKARGLASSRRIKHRVGRLTEWTATPGVQVLAWVAKSTPSQIKKNARAKEKANAKAAADAVGTKPRKSAPAEAPIQIRTAGEIPRNLPPPTLAGIFQQMNRSDT